MNHADHVRLLHDGILEPGGIWADLGSGSGAFTLALADLLGPSGEIYSVDRDSSALREQERRMRMQFPDRQVHYLTADFTRPLALPPLDGVIMANSLHFIKHGDKERVLEQIIGYLEPSGRLLLVEYNADRGNLWVPYPLSFPVWNGLATQVGLVSTRLLATVPSHFLREIYSALSLKQGM